MKALIAAALTTVLGTPAYAHDAKITQAVTVQTSIGNDHAKRAAFFEMQALLIRAEQAAADEDDA
jgi:hypothetical protein